jgi:hypothetical protein
MNLETMANALLRSIMESGALDSEDPADIAFASRVAREEMREFAFAESYHDERIVAENGGASLVLAVLTAECVQRIRRRRPKRRRARRWESKHSPKNLEARR